MVSQVIHPGAASVGGCDSVLVVDDDESSRRALQRLLVGCGYRVRAFGSAEEALTALNNISAPSVALIDLDLPGMSGLDLIARLRERDASVYPILVTAADQETLTRRWPGRAIAYLRKPVEFSELLTILNGYSPAS